jgi:branched-subunit amino acid ABC-type transport system permease component
MLDLAVYGVVWGASIAFVTLALGLSWRVLGILDFGLAGVYALVGYVLYVLVGIYELSLWIAVPLALLSAPLAQLLIYRLIYAHFLATRQSLATVVLISLAVLYIIQNVIVLIFGSAGQVVITSMPVRVNLGVTSLLVTDLVLLASLAVTMIAIHLLLARTNLGLTLRGMAGNPDLAQTFGVNGDRVRQIVFGLSGLLVAIPAVIGSLYDPITPVMGFNPILFAFAGFVIASVRVGLGHIRYIVAGLLLGLMTGMSLIAIPSQWQLAVPFGAMVLITVVRFSTAPTQRTV